MFRAQQNAFDEVVVKATDENLTSENWEYIMAVCDKVSDSDSGPKDAIAAVIKRLGHRNANVQLYTLELANALSQNCGITLHRELASRSFTEALLRLAGERNTHQKVKAKILERMTDWVEMFSKNPELGIMEQAYMRLKAQNPHLHPPSQPPKTMITEADRRREDEELQMALALSIKDKERSSAVKNKAPAQSSSQLEQSAEPVPVPSGTTAATVSRVRALYDFTPSEPGELAFRKGDVIAVLESVFKDWWKGSLRGQTGIFPLNYVEKLQDPTKEELEREAHMEAEVFAEIKNVEKLLALLSTSEQNGRGDVRDNEEITTLYHSTLAIRPKLIELIGKYSQKKDDFTQLNEKFIKARRDYEQLLEASMAHPPPPAQYGSYGRPPYQQYGDGRSQQGYGPPYQGQPPAQQQQQPYYPPSQDPNYPQANGPQPFYFIPPSQQPQGQQAPLSPKPDNASSDDLYSAPPRTNVAARPASIAFDPRVPQAQPMGGQHPPGAPQELASSSYDSPVDGRPFQQPPPQAQAVPSAPPAGPSAPYDAYAQVPRPASAGASKPQNAIYSLPSQSQARIQAQSQGPESFYSQQRPPTAGSVSGAAGVPPTSTSPVQTGYPPQGHGYPGYQAYNPSAGRREVEGGWTGAAAGS